MRVGDRTSAPTWIYEVVSHAETLKEKMARLAELRASGAATRRNGPGCDDAKILADKWQNVLGGTSGDDRLARRLEWAGWSRHDLENLFAETQSCGLTDLPTWAAVIVACSTDIAKKAASGASEFSSKEKGDRPRGQEPFEELITPLVMFAKDAWLHKMREGELCIDTLFSKRAQRDLVNALRLQLVVLCEATFYECFLKSRPPFQNLMLSLEGAEENAEHTYDLYDKFVDDQLQDGLQKSLENYPMLARLIGTTIENWVAACCEFTHRLANDWEDLNTTFGSGEAWHVVERIQTGLSDPHKQGRGVFILQFSGGAQVVYKPRNLGLEDELAKFSHQLTQNLPVSVRMPAVLSRDVYGWTKYVATESEHGDQDNEVFWRNAGALLAVFHFVGGRDAHNENVVVTKDAPVLVDAEVSFSAEHAFCERKPEDEIVSGVREFQDRLTATGLLPYWRKYGPGANNIDDASGLGALFENHNVVATECLALKRDWIALNSDQMRPDPNGETVRAAQSLEGRTNRSQTSRTRHQAAEPEIELTDQIIDLVIDGFELVYRNALDNAESIVEAVDRFQSAKTRLLHRPTRTYGLLLHGACQPAYLKSGLDFGCFLEQSMKYPTKSEKRPFDWQVFEDSLAQMTMLDVPYFCSTVGSGDITNGVNSDKSLCATWESGADGAKARVRSASNVSLKTHKAFIRATFESRRASERPSVIEKECCSVAKSDHHTSFNTSPESLIDEALKIGARIQARSVTNDHRTYWFAPTPTFETGNLTAQPTGLGLYGGACGVAIFLAALDQEFGEARFEKTWVDALAPLRAFINRKIPEAGCGLGMARGLGGYLYALALLKSTAQVAQHDWIDETAQAIVRTINPKIFAGEPEHDLLGGVAGLLLGLLAYKNSSGDPKAFDAAQSCAHYLVNSVPRLTQSPDGSTPPLLCGMSHGASGLALALGRFWKQAPSDELKTAIKALLDYEDQHFDPYACNWKDLRSDQEGHMRAWCHGAPGILMAREDLLRNGIKSTHCFGSIGSEKIGRVIGVETQTSCQHHLCCGLAGQIETILFCADVDHDKSSHDMALSLAGHLANQHKRQTIKTYHWDHQPFFDPGLFHGLAGIGYTLLRSSKPHKHPSVLGFDVTPCSEPARACQRAALQLNSNM